MGADDDASVLEGFEDEKKFPFGLKEFFSYSYMYEFITYFLFSLNRANSSRNELFHNFFFFLTLFCSASIK